MRRTYRILEFVLIRGPVHGVQVSLVQDRIRTPLLDTAQDRSVSFRPNPPVTNGSICSQSVSGDRAKTFELNEFDLLNAVLITNHCRRSQLHSGIRTTRDMIFSVNSRHDNSRHDYSQDFILAWNIFQMVQLFCSLGAAMLRKQTDKILTQCVSIFQNKLKHNHVSHWFEDLVYFNQKCSHIGLKFRQFVYEAAQ